MLNSKLLHEYDLYMFNICYLFLVLNAIDKEMENTQNTLRTHQMLKVSDRCDVTPVSGVG